MQYQVNNFQNKVQTLLEQTHRKIFHKQDIINKYNVTMIDHMMIYKNDKYFICFYDYVGNNSLTIEEFNNFTYSVNIIANAKQMTGIGIIVSKKSLCLSSKNQLDIENNKFQKESFTYYYSFCELNEVKLLQKVQNFLHSKQIYMYYSDGDCIMGDNIEFI